MAKVIWSSRAFAQLETKNLETHSSIGQVEPLLKHKKSEYRYLIAFSYKIIYRVDAQTDKIIVSRVFSYLS